jgi:Anti-sigma factor NepR
VTKAAKSNNPSIKVAGITIFETPSIEREAGCSGSSKESGGGACLKKTSTKSEIADQIGLHLRNVYDDILAQPVPGRFLDLLRQLESSSEVRTSKDGM